MHNAIDRPSANVGHNRLQRGQVAVDVRDDRQSHCFRLADKPPVYPGARAGRVDPSQSSASTAAPRWVKANVRPNHAEDVDEALRTRQRLVGAGLEYDEVVVALDREVVEEFGHSFRQLLDGVASKRRPACGGLGY
jgi:hypothetical protein